MCVVWSELLGNYQEDNEVEEKTPTGYRDSEQAVRAFVNSWGINVYVHIAPYNWMSTSIAARRKYLWFLRVVTLQRLIPPWKDIFGD